MTMLSYRIQHAGFFSNYAPSACMKMRKPERPCSDVAVFIGDWSNGERGGRLSVVNPASGDTIGEVPKASRFDLDRAVVAAEAGFA